MKRLSLLLLSFVMLFAAAQARKRTFRMADYGVTPGAENLSAQMQKALAGIKAQVQPGDCVTLRFKKGTYNFHPQGAAVRTYYISNHDQDNPKHVAIELTEWENLTLDGGGASFVCHGRMLPLALLHCKNTVLRNFSIDFAKPHITQVQVVANSPEGGITFRPAPWVDCGVDGGKFFAKGEGWQFNYGTGIAFNPETHHMVYRTSDLGIDLNGVQAQTDGTYLAPNWRDERLPEGTVVALRTYARPAPGIFLDSCTQTALRNVKVHYAEGMGLLAQLCTDVTLQKFSVCLRGKSDPRYFTTQADATHFSQCRGRISVAKGMFESMMDDAINVHGIYLKVKEIIDRRTLRCSYEHNQAWGFAWGQPGDTVSFVRAVCMDVKGDENVIESIKPADQPTNHGAKEFVIRFKNDVPREVCTDETYGVENLSATPEVIFRRCTVRNNRARGALFSSPRRTVCERNFFDHTSGTAVLLCGDCNGWFESGAVRDLVIRKNRFLNALTNQFQFTNAVISIYPEIPRINIQKGYFHGGKRDAILIEDNVFETFDKPLIYAHSVDGITVRRNTVKRNNDFPAYHPNNKEENYIRCRTVDSPGYEQAAPQRIDLQ